MRQLVGYCFDCKLEIKTQYGDVCPRCGGYNWVLSPRSMEERRR